MRNGTEPPYLATVSHTRAELLWKEGTPLRIAEYVQRVEVTYYTENEPINHLDDGATTETDSEQTDQLEERDVVPTLRKKVPRYFVSDFNAENLQKLRVHVDNPHYAALTAAVKLVIDNHEPLRSALGEDFDLDLDPHTTFFEIGTCPAYMSAHVIKEKRFVIKGDKLGGGGESA